MQIMEQPIRALNRIKSNLGIAPDMGEVMASGDPIEILISQHREVDALFAQIEQAGDKAYKTKERLFEMLANKLMLHTELEERIFYPAARDIDKEIVLESFEEHLGVKNMIKRLMATKGTDETFDAKLKVLKDIVEHHVKEEENNLFPKCRNDLDEEQLQELGQMIRERMEKAMKPHPKPTSRKSHAKDTTQRKRGAAHGHKKTMKHKKKVA